MVTFTKNRNKIRTAIAAGAFSLVIFTSPSLASADSLTDCNSASVLDTYSAQYYALAKEQGKQTPGRNIRRYGLDDKTPSTCKDLRKSTDVLRRLRNPAPVVVTVASSASSYSTTTDPQTSNYSGGGGTNSHLQSIKQCESGGNYSARSGPYGGAYQFDSGTWASVGGSGDPASASPAEQDKRAQMLYNQRGGQPWPVCSQR